MKNKAVLRFCIPIILFIFMVLIFVTYAYFKNQNAIATIIPSSSTAAPPNSNQTVTLDYYIWSDEESYIMPVIKNYNNSHPNIQVKLHTLSPSFYDSQILRLLSSDTKVDLIGIRSTSKMVSYEEKNELLPLTSFIRNSNIDVTNYGSMFNDITIDNVCYAMPTRSTCWVLYYNKTLFDKAGLDYPEKMTWDEYRKLANELTYTENNSQIYGGYWVPWCYNFAALQCASYLIDDDLSPTKTSLEMLNNFYNIDHSHVPFEATQVTDSNCLEWFESGKVAMMPQGEWFVNMLLEDEKNGNSQVDWDIAPLPVLHPHDSNITWGQYQYVSIANKCKYPTQAFDFTQYLCGTEGARIFAQNGIIHAYSNDEIKQLYISTVGKRSASLFFKTKKVQEQLTLSGYDAVSEAFNTCAKDYLFGKQTLDDTMERFEEKRAQILN